jgi:putative heme-binding domain-containing protein
MKYKVLCAVVITFFTISCQKTNTNKAVISSSDAERIVLVGGTLISSMEEFPFFETALTYQFSDDNFSLRNIGWPADDVFGLARSQFGSAQNTRSWAPPSMEDGFGSKVLMDHIKEAEPKTLIVGYGPETAFYNSEEEFALFESGYEKLLDFADSTAGKIFLLTPPQQELITGQESELTKRNENLSRATAFISKLAEEKGHFLLNLNEQLITDPSTRQFTRNGVQLNKEGYQRMSDLLLQELGLPTVPEFVVNINDEEEIIEHQNSQVRAWKKTVNGIRFYLTPNKMTPRGKIVANKPAAIYINGQIQNETMDSIHEVSLNYDSIQHQRLVETIQEKNRLYRYRLRPLNEAYIYLFRKHEMGHLAYEMDDLLALVYEKEAEISQMFSTTEQLVEVEFIKPWTPPKTYADDEVPNFIPEPNIAEELAAFDIAEGFEINLFAKDPMLANPINISWDTKGRAWVATSSTYPHIVPGREPNDKIVILEDTDGDGIADKHTVFAENLLVPHSVMPVKGGAYVVATTQLLFLEDSDGDDKADKTHVIFDGFGNADVHHTIHGLRWTPWGDLHFTQGIYINTFLETAQGPKVLNGSGIWSFRPESQNIEVFSRGLVNPWGEAFDKWGQAFATDGAGSWGVNYIFPESAHVTAVGTSRTLKNLTQGTPKFTAAEIIYSSHFPADWQGTAITNDFRANRTVRFTLNPVESSYRSEEVQTVLRSEHRSYRPVDSKVGPDGALYIVDWYNPIVDHGEVDFHHPVRDKSHGRIWRLTNKNKSALKVFNYEAASTAVLLDKLKSSEQVSRILANRALVEREVSAENVISWIKNLNRSSSNYNVTFLEGLWLLAAINEYDESLLEKGISSSNHHVRAASTRLIGHYNVQSAFSTELEKSILDKHPQVRLETLHALREQGGTQAANIASKVMALPMDDDIDYALSKTLADLQPAWIKDYAASETLFNGDPNTQMFALLTSETEENLPFINNLLNENKVDEELQGRARKLIAKIGDQDLKTDVLDYAIENNDLGLLRSLANAPEKFDAIPSNINLLKSVIENDTSGFRSIGLKLAGRWKATEFHDLILATANDSDNTGEKIEAFRALEKMDAGKEVIEIAKTHVDEKTKAAALSVWLASDMETATNTALTFLQESSDDDAAELIFNTFRRQENGPKTLEEALEGKELSEQVASIGLRIVQTSGLNLIDLEKALKKAGSITALGLELTAEEKSTLLAEAKEDGNKGRGQRIYRRKEMMCGSCHQVDKEGGLSGPYLGKIGTFMSPEAILESLLNPSSTIKQNYETVIVTRKDGEVINGILHRKTADATEIRQANSQIVEIPNSEIGNTDVSPNSLMPPGLTRNLHKDELKDLLAYLMSLGVEN